MTIRVARAGAELDLRIQPSDPPNVDRPQLPAITDLRLPGLKVNQ